MTHYSDPHFMHPEAEDLQVAWSTPLGTQHNPELPAQYSGYMPPEVGRSGQPHGTVYPTHATTGPLNGFYGHGTQSASNYTANALQGLSGGPAYDFNAHQPRVQSELQNHYTMVQPGFEQTRGVLAPERLSQYHIDRPHAEQSNQAEVMQGISVDHSYQHTNDFNRRSLWSGEDEDMASDSENDSYGYDGQADNSYTDERDRINDMDGFREEYGRRGIDEEHSNSYDRDSDVYDGEGDGDHGRLYPDDEDNLDDDYSVSGDDGYSGGHEDGSGQDDDASERNEEVDSYGYRLRSASPNHSYGGSRSPSDSQESSESFPSIHGILNRSRTQASSILETRTLVSDPRLESRHRHAMNRAPSIQAPPAMFQVGSSSSLVHNWVRSAPGQQDSTPGNHTARSTSGAGHNVNGAPSRIFSSPGPSSLAVLKEGRKRFGSPLSTASKTDERGKHISKKYKHVTESAQIMFPSSPSRVQPSGPNASSAASPSSVVEGRSHRDGSRLSHAGSLRVAPSRAGSPLDVSSHAGPSTAGPAGASYLPPVVSDNPYAVPASRGEIAEVRKTLDGLITAVRNLSATCTRLASAQEQDRPQAGPAGSAGPGRSPPQGPSERFEAKRKGAPVRRSDDALMLSLNVQEYARTLLKRETADSPFDTTTLATPREVKRWKNSKKGEFCCTKDNFRIDIASGALNDWNRSAAVVFADAFIDSGDYECEDPDLIADVFMTHLRTLRKKFRERDRTIGEVQDAQKKARRDQRKEKLFHRRRRTALQNPELAPHLPMLETFGVDGMSSDESVRENGEVRYRILKKSWRPEVVTEWLAGFDAVDAVTRGKRGRKPHKRVVSTKLDDSREPVQGLPQNAYNSRWYATIGPFDRTKLRRGESGYSFQHCDAVQVVLKEYTRQINNPAQYR